MGYKQINPFQFGVVLGWNPLHLRCVKEGENKLVRFIPNEGETGTIRSKGHTDISYPINKTCGKKWFFKEFIPFFVQCGGFILGNEDAISQICMSPDLTAIFITKSAWIDHNS